MTDPAGAGRKMLTIIGGILMGSMEHHIYIYIAAPLGSVMFFFEKNIEMGKWSIILGKFYHDLTVLPSPGNHG